VNSYRVIPMEEEGIDVTPETIISFFASFSATVEGVPDHFVMNMDKMGHQDWIDRQHQNH
jgi:hypothetical protein